MTLGARIAVGVFALLVTLGPLAFGAVDRPTQVVLVALLAVGVCALPPATAPLGVWGRRLVWALVAVLLLKEFLPAAWFGGTAWREELVRNLGLTLPPTHHPEPARVLDALLVGVVGLVWFRWVRTLASDHERRHHVAWILFLGTVIVAGVSFATRGMDPQGIYGLRYTPGWTGFGPFPNRNHSATLFAMGAVLGFGCAAWAWVRVKRPLFAIALVFTGFLVAALLETESRGGLVSFTAGIVLFIGLVFAKLRNRTVVFSGLAILLVVGALTAAFGSKVLTRFQSPVAGHVSTHTRLAVWHDALGLWRDAPLLGHGVGAFRSVFPLYQSLDEEEIVVLHPESSWLQWLTELGFIPVALGVAALALFLVPQVRSALARTQSFYLRAGALAAFGVLLLHSVFDVPAHRWGTAALGLAMLALACPIETRLAPARLGGKSALPLLALAAFWAAPLVSHGPAWSPLHLTQLLARDSTGGDVQLSDFQRSLRYFPLNPWLHQGFAARQMHVDGRARPGVWQRHFAIAARLTPNSWTVPAAQARLSRRFAPELSLAFWQQAVDRGTLHRSEIFTTAMAETRGLPDAAGSWARYVESNPKLLLDYAATLPDETARSYYTRWLEERATAGDLAASEVEAFYQQVVRLGKAEDLQTWMQHHAAREATDYRRWAGLLHQWGDEAQAWQLLARRIPEPGYPEGLVSIERNELETKYRLAPENAMNAQQLAQLLHHDGAIAESEEIVLAVATQTKAPPPPWFTRKAAHILARLGRQGEAVATLLASK
jgi:O-antigen ligase